VGEALATGATSVLLTAIGLFDQPTKRITFVDLNHDDVRGALSSFTGMRSLARGEHRGRPRRLVPKLRRTTGLA
jgi:hypothetical protein